MGAGGKFLRRLRARVSDRPTGFVWVEDRALAGSGYPASRAQVTWLAHNGIGSILSLTEDPIPPAWVDGLGVRTGHIPMKDHQAPSLESMGKGVKFIQAQRIEGRSVLVHCLAGEGRTGCVLAAYLISTKDLGPGEALETLRRLKPGFVELKQEKAVYEFASYSKDSRGPR